MSIAKSKVLVTGTGSMLAGDLIPRLLRAGAEVELTGIVLNEVYGISVTPLDITDMKAVNEVLSDIRPDWIINCAAYTAVDNAETDEELAFMVNGEGVGNLAKAAADTGAKLVHFSTDYVFGAFSAVDRPYREEDPTAPCGVYGKSKRSGEELLFRYLPENHLLVRTSWLHGIHGGNFINTILRLAKEREEIRVVNDQVGSPTWAGWLADVLVELMGREVRGIMHAASRGEISWFTFAEEIIAQAGLTVRLVPQSTDELGRPAPRPAYAALDVSRLESLLGRECITWKDCIREHLAALKARG